MSNYQQASTAQSDPDREQRAFSFKATQLIWLAIGLLEGALALRILLKLIGANADNAFAGLLYRVTDLFLVPFVGLTGTPAAGGLVLEISSVIAMIVYFLLAWALERLVWVLFYRPRTSAVSTQTTITDRRLP
jgi:hypothetical protein